MLLVRLMVSPIASYGELKERSEIAKSPFNTRTLSSFRIVPTDETPFRSVSCTKQALKSLRVGLKNGRAECGELRDRSAERKSMFAEFGDDVTAFKRRDDEGRLTTVTVTAQIDPAGAEDVPAPGYEHERTGRTDKIAELFKMRDTGQASDDDKPLPRDTSKNSKMCSGSRIESGPQLFRRLSSSSNFINGINPALFPNGGPLPNKVIEITGESHVEKTDLVIDFIVRSILPSRLNKEWRSSGVILINTEFQINIFKIIKVIEAHLLENKVKESKMHLIEEALKSLIIINCYSLEDTELAFYNIEKLLFNIDKINLVIVDNIAANYWIAKLNNNMLSYFQHSLKMFEIIFNVIRQLNATLLFVRHENKDVKKVLKNVDYQIKIEYSSENKFNYVITNHEDDSFFNIAVKIENNILRF
ncbi:unnamed protein product [Acanthoscelides obtectus]|uniref:DNA recombination and repair protein Rad51-like C-terminal domain-containing protein n=1 Tax=Acanthoscelides obtectus TaxID=200917 RepID=A0A9P0KE40_ACAOB|nr:unnamed protein product [Acanthoscelides obtectus]CAK1672699.1 DNA repair protein XRCC2 [Acanthoscelides obtectus]